MNMYRKTHRSIIPLCKTNFHIITSAVTHNKYITHDTNIYITHKISPVEHPPGIKGPPFEATTLLHRLLPMHYIMRLAFTYRTFSIMIPVRIFINKKKRLITLQSMHRPTSFFSSFFVFNYLEIRLIYSYG